MPDRLPQDEIDVLRGQVAALTHCVGFLLATVDRISRGLATEWLDRRNVIAANDLRREGIDQVLDHVRETLERHAPRSVHDDDDT